MKKKLAIRIFLVSFIFTIFLLIFFKLYNQKQVIKNELEVVEEEIENSNIIKDVSYNSKDSKGNEYNLKASEGVIDQKENNYIFLTDVKANINLSNYNFIEISSDFGKYNVTNYDTIFSNNELIRYLNYEIKGQNLEFSWDKNLMIISSDVILKNNKNSLEADVIEINIQNKDVKIFMYEENDKVNIKSLN